MFDISQIVHTKTPILPHFKKIFLLELVEDVLRLLKEQLQKAGVEPEVSIPPKAMVYADEKLIQQVMINLVSNAVHAMDNREGEKKLKIESIFDEAKIILEITDNGKGIPMDIIDKIFIPFFTTRKDGSGIGLSLSKSIMDKHGGDLFVNSTEGKTTFSLLFNK